LDGVTDARHFSEDGFHPGPPLYAAVVARLSQHIASLAPLVSAPSARD
jgi:lysophospholipase L1-like esterase